MDHQGVKTGRIGFGLSSFFFTVELTEASYDMTKKKLNITKLCFAVCVPVAFTVLSSFDTDLPVVYLFALALLGYTVPLILTSVCIKKGEINALRHALVSDLLFLFVPFVSSALVTDIVVSLISGSGSWTGMAALTLILMAVMMTGVFWIKYVVDIKRNSRS